MARAGLLIACVDDAPAATSSALWAYDGDGWWRLRATDNPCWPYAAGGYFANATLIAHDANVARAHACQLRPTLAQPDIPASAALVSSLWSGRDADDEKVWTNAGVEVGLPGDPLVTDPYTLALDYSLDCGATWMTITSATLAYGGPYTLGYRFQARGKAIMLRVRWEGLTGYAPAVRAMWAEHRPIEQVAHRDSWEFVVVAEDQQQRRAGAEARNGGQIAADLWAAFRAGGTVAFRDIDYDRDPVERQVRIATLTEEIARPADAGRWGESRLRVRLVEA